MKRQIAINGKMYEVEYDATDESSSPSASSAERPQSLVLPTPPVPGTSGPMDVDESKVCRSPVAGIVARINVEPGQSVQAGEIVVVVDAMKMENNLAAAVSAKVNSVRVKVGDAVTVSQIVVEFE